MSIIGPRSIQKTQELRFYCNLVCKWEKVRSTSGRRYYKRLSNKAIRGALKADLRRETDAFLNPLRTIGPD